MALRHTGVAVWLSLAVLLVACPSLNADSAADRLRAVTDQLEQWLATSPNGAGWRTFLQTERLRAEVAKGSQADPRTVWELLGKFCGNTPGLEVAEFYKVRRAIEDWLAELPPPPVDRLGEEIALAKNVFVPRTANDTAEAKASLLAAARRLDERLKREGANGEAWRKFVRLDQMLAELGKDAPDLRALDDLYDLYESGREGLRLTWFADVREGLRAFLSTSRAVGDPKVKEWHQKALDELEGLVDKYRSKPSSELAAEINAQLAWLQLAGQPRRVVLAVQNAFSYPNLFIHISAPVVGAGMAGPVSDTSPISDNIMGTSIQGTSTTNGQITVHLVPTAHLGVIDLVFQAVIHANSVGYNGPVQIHSSSVSQVASRKRLLLDPMHAVTMPAATNAVTSSTIHNITGSSRAVSTAWSQANQQKPQAEQAAARRAEERTNQRMDQRTDEGIARMNAQYAGRYRDPLLDRGLFPRMAKVSTTSDFLVVTALEGRITELAAPDAPLAPKEPADLVLQIHESTIHNGLGSAFAGMIMEEHRFLATLEQMLGEVPERFKREKDDKSPPWALTYAAEQPISVRFQDGSIKITLRGQKYVRGDSEFPEMNVTALYKPQKAQDKIKLVRQGPLEIVPPDFVPGGGDALSGRAQVLKTLLEKRFNRIFEPEIVPEPITFSGNWKRAGQLGMVECQASGGWLVVGWRRIPGTEQPAEPPQPAPAAN